MVFVSYNVFGMVFWGGIFGGRHYNRPDPYLNNTIVLCTVWFMNYTFMSNFSPLMFCTSIRHKIIIKTAYLALILRPIVIGHQWKPLQKFNHYSQPWCVDQYAIYQYCLSLCWCIDTVLIQYITWYIDVLLHLCHWYSCRYQSPVLVSLIFVLINCIYIMHCKSSWVVGLSWSV